MFFMKIREIYNDKNKMNEKDTPNKTMMIQHLYSIKKTGIPIEDA